MPELKFKNFVLPFTPTKLVEEELTREQSVWEQRRNNTKDNERRKKVKNMGIQNTRNMKRIGISEKRRELLLRGYTMGSLKVVFGLKPSLS